MNSTIREKTYSIPLKHLYSPDKGRVTEPFLINLRLSVPQLQKGAEGVHFAEHVYDRKLKSSTENVILAGRGMVCESKDNGSTWELIKIPEVEDRRLYNCFTTDDGNHLVHSLPEQDLKAKNTNHNSATLFLFDKNWKLISVDESAKACWHGRASIDQSGNTIMFSEYHNNRAKYNILYRDDYALWRPLMEISRVYRSRDGGITWQVVFEMGPEVIRHFHTLQADPFLPRTWWLSSGDRYYESRVWRSNDDGDTWFEVTSTNPNIIVPKSIENKKQSIFRYTDLIIDKDFLIWGSDDILGSANEITPQLAQKYHAGSRIYRAIKSNPLQVEELGYIGQSVRSIVDVGPAYLFITEANISFYPLNPQVIVLFKDNMTNPIEIARIDNFKNIRTGFCCSKASKTALNGRFFSYRLHSDVFNQIGPSVLQWDIVFS